LPECRRDGGLGRAVAVVQFRIEAAEEALHELGRQRFAAVSPPKMRASAKVFVEERRNSDGTRRTAVIPARRSTEPDARS
jgi:hypothetical protein